MGLEPVKITRRRRQTPTSTPVGSGTSATDSGTPPPTSGQSSAPDTSTGLMPPTTSSEAPISTVPPPSDSSSPTVVSTAPPSSPSSIGPSSSQADGASPSNPSMSSQSTPAVGPSSASPSSSSSQSVSSSSARTPSGSSTIPSSTSSSSISPASSSTASSSTASSATVSPTSSSTSASSSSSDPSTSTTLSQTPTSSADSTVSLTTITSSIVTTIDGHATTIATAFPTSLNSPPSTTPSSGRRTGIIAGSAIAAGLLALLTISGLFVFYRRRNLRKISLAHRALPTPRSALLADEDAFDLADSAPFRPMGESGGGAPQLLRPRGLETGSIFHEGVWPPPGERSRLEDPLLVGSTVDLTSIVDEIMGAGDQHGRSMSADTTRSDVPLLENISPERSGNTQKGQSSTPAPHSRLAVSASDAKETTPLNPSGHEHQLSDDSSPDVPRSPPPAGPSTGAAASAGIERFKSGRSILSVSTTGSPPSEFTHMRGTAHAGAAGAGFGLGSLVVVNATPEAGEREELEREQDRREQQRGTERPLVDLTSVPEDSTPPREIPPLYHMIPQNASDTWATPPRREETSDAAVALHPTKSPQSPQSSTSAQFGQAL